jgi:hypothetical protein
MPLVPEITAPSSAKSPVAFSGTIREILQHVGDLVCQTVSVGPRYCVAAAARARWSLRNSCYHELYGVFSNGEILSDVE